MGTVAPHTTNARHSNIDTSFIFFQGISNDPPFTSSTVHITHDPSLPLSYVDLQHKTEGLLWTFPWNRPDPQVTAMICSIAFIIWDPEPHTALSEQQESCIQTASRSERLLHFILCCTVNPCVALVMWCFLFPQVRASSIQSKAHL